MSRRPTAKRTLNVTLAVTAPGWMTPAQVAREVQTLINEQHNFLSTGGPELGYPEVKIKATRVSAKVAS